jgi:S1-C subfamily serine protease
VRTPKLRALARTPTLPVLAAAQPATGQSNRDSRTATWLGATVRNVVGLGEVSASGLSGETGVMVVDVPVLSQALTAGLRRGDVILRVGTTKTDALPDLLRIPSREGGEITVWRDQREVVLRY